MSHLYCLKLSKNPVLFISFDHIRIVNVSTAKSWPGIVRQPDTWLESLRQPKQFAILPALWQICPPTAWLQQQQQQNPFKFKARQPPVSAAWNRSWSWELCWSCSWSWSWSWSRCCSCSYAELCQLGPIIICAAYLTYLPLQVVASGSRAGAEGRRQTGGGRRQAADCCQSWESRNWQRGGTTSTWAH